MLRDMAAQSADQPVRPPLIFRPNHSGSLGRGNACRAHSLLEADRMARPVAPADGRRPWTPPSPPPVAMPPKAGAGVWRWVYG